MKTRKLNPSRFSIRSLQYSSSQVINSNSIWLVYRNPIIISLLLIIGVGQVAIGQTTEDFETETIGATSFTANSVQFDFSATGGGSDPWDIEAFNGGGWNGSTPDNRFIDNSGLVAAGAQNNDGASITIVRNDGGTFSVQELFVFLSTNNLTNPSTTSISFIGNVGGIQQYSFTKTSGFSNVQSLSPNNGFTRIDFATEGSSDFSGDTIDELIITSSGDGEYMALDAFQWSPGISVSAPTAQATSPVFGLETSTTLTLSSFTAPAGGADGYAIYINSTNSFSVPLNGTEPVADLTWDNTGQQPIYFGTSTSPNITVTDLSVQSQYYFQIYAYNDDAGTEIYESTGLNADDITAAGSGISSSGVLDFNTADNTNLGPIAEDGEGGSSSFPGVTFNVFIGNGSGTATGGDIFYDNSGGGYEGLSASGSPGSTGFSEMILITTDGTEFDFNGFSAAEYGFVAFTIKVEGFKNGGSTGSTTVSITGFGTQTYGSGDFSDAIFGDVDEVRITSNSGGTIFGTFDEFLVAPPVGAPPVTSGTFDWETASDAGATVSQTVNTVTATVSTSNADAQLVNGGGFEGSTANVVFTQNPDVSTSLTINFSSSVDVASIFTFIADADVGAETSITYTPTGGSNSVVIEGIAQSAGEVVNLNWTNVTAITLTVSGGGTETFGIDDIVLGTSSNSAPTDIALTSSSISQSSTGINASVGTLTTTDADVGDSHTYSLVAGSGDGDNGSFNISGNTLRTNSSLTAGSYNIRINTNDGTDDYSEAFVIAVIDDIPPTVITQNINAYLNGAGTVSITPADVDNGSSDASGISSLTLSQSSFACADVGANSVTLTVTDNTSNQNSASATVTVIDTISPTTVAQNITVYLDGAGNVNITANDIDNGSSDNCGVQSLSADVTSFTCADAGANNVTLTVTDVNSNTSTATATVTVVDTISPTAVAQNITVYLDGAGNASITANDIDNGSSDNCGVQSLSADVTSFTCADVGANNVTLTVTDVNSNTSTETSTVTVVDTISPTATTQNITVYLDGTGNVSITANDIDNGSSDNCGVQSLSADVTSFTCADVGANIVTLTVTDVNSNTSTASATVTIVDTISPTAVAQNITVFLDGTGNVSITANDIDNGSSDNCGVLSLSADATSFTCADVGANNVTLTVTDVNSNTSTATATVTVLDTISPAAVVQNITVYLDGTGNASITANDIDNGSSDNCGVQSISADITSFTCADVGANNVTLTVTDVNSNTSTATATVTVVDTISPTATTQNITVYLDGTGNVSITANDIDNGSSDNCGVQSLSTDVTSFTCADVGANNVTLTVTDVDSNTSTATATVTVVDTISPTAATQNITVYLDGAGNASITANDIDNGSSDNCGVQSLSADITSFTCADVGANNVTLTVTDVNSNTSTATATVTVVDTISPTAVAQNITVYLDGAGNASITANDIDNGSSDNCGVQSLSADITSFTCADVGANNVILTVTDVNSNTSTAASTVTVVDTISPTAATQNITVYLDGAGNASITANDIDNGSSDNCDVQSLSTDVTSFTCADLGPNVVTLTVTDLNGNLSSASSSVTVRDTTAPSVSTQNLEVYLDANGQASILPTDADLASSDNCQSSLQFSVSQSNFSCADEGLNVETLTVTDGDGNSSQATFLIEVKDTIKPNLITRNITAQLGATGQVTISPSQFDNGSTDNCSNQLFFTASKTSFTCSDLGTNTIMITATDVNNNVSTANATITIEDNVLPVAVTQNLTVYLDAGGTASITAAQVNNGSSDNCSIVNLSLNDSLFNCDDVGVATVILTATDPSGNSTFSNAIVNVLDTISPSAVAQNIAIYLDGTGNASITANDIDHGSSDNCGVQSLSADLTSFTCADVGANNVILTVTDVNSNTSTASATVTIVDTISPTAVAQNITVFLDGTGNVSITANDIDNGSSDNCGVQSLSADVTSFTCADVGANNVTLTVTDVNSNTSTATATVTVVDTISPAAVVQNFTVYLDGTGNASITANDIDNGSSDNCGVQSLLADITSFTCADVGANNVIFTVTDVNSNTSTATATVTVVDTISPAAVTQNITVYLDGTGNASITANDINNGSSDNCGVQSLSADITLFTCADVGANNVTLTVTDFNFNTSTASAIVTVVDSISPVALLKSNVTLVLNAGGQASLAFSQIDSSSADNCSSFTASLSSSMFTCVDLGLNTVNVTLTDLFGNSTTKSVVIQVVDRLAPSIQVTNTTVYLNSSGQVSITPAQVDNGTFDNCGVDSLWLDIDVFDCADLGQNLVTLFATDASGNQSAANTFVNVLDTITPNIVNLPSTINAYVGSGQCSVPVQWPSINSMDNCSGISVSTSSVNGGLFNLGTHTVYVSVSDLSGNQSLDSFQINVIDTVSPSFTFFPSTYTVTPDPNSCSATVTWNSPVAVDNCSNVTLSSSVSSGSTFPLGNTMVSFTASDAAGNSRVQTLTISVTDLLAPVFTSVPGDTTLSADAGTCSVTFNYAPAQATDNCGAPTFSYSVATGSSFNIGVNVVTVQATDAAGNSITHDFNVTVVDTESPVVVSVPASDTVGACNSQYTYSLPVATDNCSQVTITQISGLSSGNIFPAGITQNSFRITDSSGNDTVVSFTIFVVPSGQPVLPGVVEICANDPQIDIALGQNIVWTGPGVVNDTEFNPSAAGPGRVTLSYLFTDDYGCTVSGQISITVNPVPVQPVIVQTGSTTISTSQVYSFYQWYRDGVAIPGATNQSYTYNQGGNYQVMVSNNSGCQAYGNGYVVGSGNGGIGIPQYTLENVTIYPNPSRGMVRIETGAPNQELGWQLYSLEGKRVSQGEGVTGEDGTLEVNFGHLSVSTYLLHVQFHSNSMVRKVIIHP